MRNLIFDLDGCLIDSSDVQRAALQGSYDEVVGDGCTVDFDEWLRFTGDSLEGALAKMGLPVEMAGPFRRISSASVGAIRPNMEAFELIGAARRDGARTALCTGKDRARTEEILAHLGVRRLFDCLVCSDEVEHPKPSAEPIVAAAIGMGESPEVTLVIGDGLNDLLAARAAGATSVLALWYGDQGVPRAEADYVVWTVGDLATLLGIW